MPTDADFLQDLATLSRELAQLLAEHLSDYDGELLPHLLIADFERHVEALWAKRASDPSGAAEAEVRQILQKLEDGFTSGPPELQELISVSFLEHLPRPEAPGGDIRNLVGPSLGRQLALIG
jgi:hypothetical protein